MKQLLSIILVLIMGYVTSSCNPNTIKERDTRTRDGVVYDEKSERPFTGRMVKYYSSYDSERKRVKEEIHLKNGKKHGLFIMLNDDGDKQIQGYYKNGKKHGLFIVYDRNGKPEKQAMFKNDIAEGGQSNAIESVLNN